MIICKCDICGATVERTNIITSFINNKVSAVTKKGSKVTLSVGYTVEIHGSKKDFNRYDVCEECALKAVVAAVSKIKLPENKGEEKCSKSIPMSRKLVLKKQME